jgi:hypothetical protein
MQIIQVKSDIRAGMQYDNKGNISKGKIRKIGYDITELHITDEGELIKETRIKRVIDET